MAYLYYTLEEAAQQLDVSPTVLVRLSQYFRLPAACYEQKGYLSFRGDLQFSEPDIAFFREIRKRILAGESLDSIKERLQLEEKEQLVQTKAVQPAGFSQQQAFAQVVQDVSMQQQMAEPEPVTQVPVPQLNEVQSEQSLIQAAEKSFNRYKGMNQETTPVFQNLLSDVTPKQESESKPSPVPQPQSWIEETQQMPYTEPQQPFYEEEVPTAQQQIPQDWIDSLEPQPTLQQSQVESIGASTAIPQEEPEIFKYRPDDMPEPESVPVEDVGDFDWAGFVQSASGASPGMSHRLSQMALILKRQGINQNLSRVSSSR